MAQIYRSSVVQLVDNITEEQMENIVSQAKGIVELVECEDGIEQHTEQ